MFFSRKKSLFVNILILTLIIFSNLPLMFKVSNDYGVELLPVLIYSLLLNEEKVLGSFNVIVIGAVYDLMKGGIIGLTSLQFMFYMCFIKILNTRYKRSGFLFFWLEFFVSNLVFLFVKHSFEYSASDSMFTFVIMLLKKNLILSALFPIVYNLIYMTPRKSISN